MARHLRMRSLPEPEAMLGGSYANLGGVTPGAKGKPRPGRPLWLNVAEGGLRGGLLGFIRSRLLLLLARLLLNFAA